MKNNFPTCISDYVRLDYVKDIGTTAIVHDNCIFPLFDLMTLPYKWRDGCVEGYFVGSLEEVRRYVGIQFCNYLKNKISQKDILNDVWMNRYLERKEIQKNLEIITDYAFQMIDWLDWLEEK